MTIPRNLSNLAPGASTAGVLGVTKGGTGLTAVGTNGQVLASNGTGLNFITPSAGAMTLISTQTASNSASVSWTGLSGYNNYVLIFNGAKNATNNQFLLLQVGTGSGPTYITSYSDFTYLRIFSGGTYNPLGGSGQTGVVLADEADNSSGIPYPSGTFNLNNFTNSLPFSATGNSTYYRDAKIINQIGSGGLSASGNIYTAIRILFASGNITSGTFSLYGISS
jgi:hypothetical protein